MSSGLAISAFMPSVISSGIFSTRRVNTSAEAISASNPLVGVMNMDIAGGQMLNVAKGVSTIAKESKSSLASGIASAEESIKALSKSGKVMNGISKVLSFTADNINPIICATGAARVITAKDKKDEALHQGTALGTMFTFEAGTKRLLGLPKFDNVDGKRVAIKRDALLTKNPFLEKQADALKDYCETTKIFNKSIKWLPGALKGVAFACSSIAGYQLGYALADKLAATENSTA